MSEFFIPDQAAVLFRDRRDAGAQLAAAVATAIAQRPTPLPCVVYALPRGGLPVALPVAQQLHCPLDVLVAKKITRPDNRELALGAVTADAQVVWARNRARAWPDFPPAAQAQALHTAQTQAQHQLAEFRQGCPQTPVSPQGAIAIVVDDGIATGMTMAAAVKSLRTQGAAAVWICVPVAPAEMVPFLEKLGDRLILLAQPQEFYSVSRFYQEFGQVSMAAATHTLQGGTDSAPATDA